MHNNGPARVNPQTLLRHLPYGVMRNVANVLDLPSDVNRNWEKLASLIPKNQYSQEPKYKQIDIDVFRLEIFRPNGSPTMELLKTWGAENATCKELVDLLLHPTMNHIQAAKMILPDYVNSQQ